MQIEDSKTRIVLPSKGGNIHLEVTLGEMMKLGEMVEKDPERFKNQEETMKALREIRQENLVQSATEPSGTSRTTPE